MGCSSSTSNDFRDLYERMLGIFQLHHRSRNFSPEPSWQDMRRRTAIFDGMHQPDVESIESALGYIENNPFRGKCTEAKFPLLQKKSNELWKIARVHPYNNVLCKDIIVALHFSRVFQEHEKDLNEEKEVALPQITRRANNWILFRWDFRLWILGMCEFYHILAILSESNSMPLGAANWFRAMHKKSNSFFQFDSNGHLCEEARIAIEQYADFRITEKSLTKQFVKQLQNEMISIFATCHGPGSFRIQFTAESIFKGASEYWRRKGDVVQMIEMKTNILQGGLKKKKNEGSNPLPFLALVEWITIRYVRSLCGSEEDKIRYLPPFFAFEELLPTLFAYEEVLVTLFALEESLPTLFANEELLPTLFGLEELVPTLFAEEELLPTLFAMEELLPTLFAGEELLPTLFSEEELLPTLFATEELLPTLFTMEELLPTLFTIEELLPTLFGNEELLPTLFATEKLLPTLFAAEELFPTLFGIEELLPTLFAEEELLPTLFAMEELLPTLFGFEEVLPTLFAGEELLPTLFSEEELLPTLFATEELLPTLFTMEELLPTLFTIEELLPTLFGNEELLPTLFATEKLLPTLFAAEELFPTLFGIEELLPTLFAEEELLPTLFATEKLLPTLFAEEELLPTLFAFLFEAEHLEGHAIRNEAYHRQLIELISEAAYESIRLEFEGALDRAVLKTLECTTRPEQSSPDDWLEVIQRLDAVDKLMADDLTTEERDALMEEKEYLMRHLQALYSKVKEGKKELALEQCQDGLYSKLKLYNLFPDKYISYQLCSAAYSSVVGSTGRNTITEFDQFHRFARSFVYYLFSEADSHYVREGTLDIYGLRITHLEVQQIKEIWVEVLKGKEVLEKRTCFSGGKDSLRPMSDLKMTLELVEGKEKGIGFIRSCLASLLDDFKTNSIEGKRAMLLKTLSENGELSDYTVYHSAASSLALDFCLKATACKSGNDKFLYFLNLLQNSQLPDDGQKQSSDAVVAPFLAKAVYIATAVLRSFESTGDDAIKGVDYQDWKNRISFDWFKRAIQEASKDFGISLDDIIKKSANYLRAMGIEADYSDPSDDEKELTEISPIKMAYFLLEKIGRTKGVTGACIEDITEMCLFGQLGVEFVDEPLFHHFLNFAFEEDAVKGKRYRKLMKFKDGKELGDCVYKSLIGEKTDDDLYQEFFSFSRGCRAIPVSSDESVFVQQTNTVMNIDSFIENFRLRYASVLEPFLYAPSIMSSVWKEAVMVATSKDLESSVLICEPEGESTSTCGADSSKVPFTARRYIRFLCYVSGWLMTLGIYAKTLLAKEKERLEDEAFLKLIVQEPLVPMLKEFADLHNLRPLSKEEEKQADYSFFASMVEASSSGSNDDKISSSLNGNNSLGEETSEKEKSSETTQLFSIANWYGRYRVIRLWPTYYDRWERHSVLRFPFSASREHRDARRSLLARLQKLTLDITLRIHGNTDGCEDGYFPTAAVVSLLEEQYDTSMWMDALGDSTAVRRAQRKRGPDGVDKEKSTASMGGDEEHQKEGRRGSSMNNSGSGLINRSLQPLAEHDFRSWVETHIISYVNQQQCGRKDLGSTEIHWSSFRFVLQYIHHCMETFFMSEEICKEVEGMIRAGVREVVVGAGGTHRGGGPESITSKKIVFNTSAGENSSTQGSESLSSSAPTTRWCYCRYTDVEHCELITQAVYHLWGPEELVEKIQEQMCSLSSTLVYPRSSAPVNPETVGHVMACQLVGHHGLQFYEAVQGYKSFKEEQLAKDFEDVWFSGRNIKELQEEMTKKASYWEILRFLLPHLHQISHRCRRQRLYRAIDRQGKGYLSVPDLHMGMTNILHLEHFRVDSLPILFRAFFATKENNLASDKVIYLTSGVEQLVTPPEFCGFLCYFYQYLELYYMFDVLTCAGRMQADGHLHQERIDVPVTASDIDKTLLLINVIPPTWDGTLTLSSFLNPTPDKVLHQEGEGCGGEGVVARVPFSTVDIFTASTSLGNRIISPLSSSSGEISSSTGVPVTPAAMLRIGASNPYQITLEASAVPKMVNIHQFCIGKFLFRHWGLKLDDPAEVFRSINSRCAEAGVLEFTDFAIWASKQNLHPEGFGSCINEESEELAALEEKILQLYCDRRRHCAEQLPSLSHQQEHPGRKDKRKKEAKKNTN